MEFITDPFKLFDRQWALVTAGTAEDFNTMTISWGSTGTLWGKPIVTVYVKPVRYTHGFLEKNDLFTVSFYPEECRKALGLLGSLSGRDCDKVARSGLTPLPLEGAVTFREATRTLVCRKIYSQDLDLSRVPEKVAGTFYTTEAPHTVYIGEVIELLDNK